MNSHVAAARCPPTYKQNANKQLSPFVQSFRLDHKFLDMAPLEKNPTVGDLVIMVAIESDPHIQSSDWSVSYTTNHVQEHGNVPEPCHEPIMRHHLPYFSRKLWIVQVQLFGHFLCIPNEESGCLGAIFETHCI
ncbi:hypothetical protein TNCV_5066131 [Trichonephila clavipes]|nr:hypothetical protein TNCV_5066131 [Trichonephila clavipes]